MPANVSVTSLCQRALLSIGGKSDINLITENSAQAKACNLLFSPTFQQLARSAWWNCLQKQATLSLIAAAADTPENPNGTPPFPQSPWLYSYLLRSDCLKARSILPTLPAQSTGGSPATTAQIAAPIWLQGMNQIPFKVAYGTDSNGNPQTIILTNQQQAVLNYTVDSENPSIWDSQFQAAFVAALAAFLVPALSMNMTLMKMNIDLAERIIAEARASDGNESTNTQDHLPDWIRARAGGSGGWYQNNWYNVGYDSVSWPVYGG